MRDIENSIVAVVRELSKPSPLPQPYGRWGCVTFADFVRGDEATDETLKRCAPLVLHTHLMENNASSSELDRFTKPGFEIRDHPLRRGIDWKSLPTLPDLLYGRTIHSLIYLLSLSINVEIFLVSPHELRLPEEYKSFLNSNKIKFSESDDLKNMLPKTDVLYMTRIQKERFSSAKLYERVKNSFILDKKLLEMLGKQSIIMHPLPRVNEIVREVDEDKRAAYFREAKNGLYIRMALLSRLFEK